MSWQEKEEAWKIDAQLSAAIHNIFGSLNTCRLNSLTRAMERIEYCNMQLGINAQVNANREFEEEVKAAIDSLSGYQKETILKNMK